LKPDGRLALADFSPYGFELVSRVLVAEGRTHPVGPVTLEWSRGFLAGLGFKELHTLEGHLHRVAILWKYASPAVLLVFGAIDRPVF
jgi:hypothetical protein